MSQKFTQIARAALGHMATQSASKPGSLSFTGTQRHQTQNQCSDLCKVGREFWVGNSSSSSCVAVGWMGGSDWRQEAGEGAGQWSW